MFRTEWATTTFDGDTVEVLSTALPPTELSHVARGDDGAVYVSIDSYIDPFGGVGVHRLDANGWHPLSTGPRRAGAGLYWFDGMLAAVPGAYAASQRGVWFSSDRGDSWTHVAGGFDALSSTLRDGTIWLGGKDGQIGAVTDGTLTLVHTLASGRRVLSIATTSDGVVWTRDDNHVITRIVDGVEAVDVGPPGVEHGNLAVHDGRVFLGGGVGRVYEYTAEGWSEAFVLGWPFSRVRLFEGADDLWGWDSHDGAIRFDGETWTTVPTGLDSSLFEFVFRGGIADSDGATLVGDLGTVITIPRP